MSFKGGTAGRAITDDLPLAAGPGATLTESNHKQVNSTSTFLIFFSPVSFFWSRSVYLDEELLFLLPPPPPLFPLFERGTVHKCTFGVFSNNLPFECSGPNEVKGFIYFRVPKGDPSFHPGYSVR